MAVTTSVGPGQPGGAAGITDDPQQLAPGVDDGIDQKQDPNVIDPTEEKLVARWWTRYEDARKFDETFRKQVAVDRRYAAGTSDLSWAVTTNLIGAYIDILVSLLYARDPDVSVRKATHVDNSDPQAEQMTAFARTMEIVISRMWKRGNLKKAARKAVRSVLSNGEGWFKCMMISEERPNVQVMTAMNDARELHDRLIAQQKLIDDPEGSPEELDERISEQANLMASLEAKMEMAINKMFVIDFVNTQDIQVAPNVQCISDYLEADWISNEVFLEKDEVAERFPDLTPSQLRSATQYFQKPPSELVQASLDNIVPQGQLTAESAQTFVQNKGAENSPPFLRVVEIQDRRDRTIKTMVDGVKKWAIQPYQPPYETSRFYGYFYFAFYEVDSQRHAQSLAWRLYKLQDEYSSVRSSFRKTRARAVPGVLFNSTMLDSENAQKLSQSTEQEFVGLKPTDPNQKLSDLFAPKPIAQIDMRLYDPSLILSDMERISGVQEALSSAQSGPGNPRTATEANIQQSGTNARTGADRDSLEDCLTDMANYTAEQTLQCLTIQDAQRIAGPAAFWPANMSIDDIQTMVDIQLQAGSTGKPRQGTDQQAWATALPQIQQTIQAVMTALAQGNEPLAQALSELLKESMLRLGDESDVERFIPKIPPPGSPGSNPPPKPVPANVSISLRGELDPITAARLAAPDVAQDAAAIAAQNAMMAAQAGGPPGGSQPGQGSAPGGTPAAPGPAGGAPPAGPGPTIQ